jgi:hypothetical protein
MKLTKEQLTRIFKLYDGFGWQPGMVPREITPVQDEPSEKAISVCLGGYAIHVDHMGRVIAPPAGAERQRGRLR